MIEASQKEIPLGSFTVSLKSVENIFHGLSRLVAEQADIDIARWVIPPGMAAEEFQASKEHARNEAYRVTVTVRYEDGSSTFGSEVAIFKKSPQGPMVSLIFMTNVSAFAARANKDPVNSFNLWLDFSQPPLMDASTLVSSPTANGSLLKIGGDRSGWMAGVERVVTSQLDIKHSMRRILHGPFVYDYGLLAVGAPLALYLCWLCMPLVVAQFASSPVLEAAAFVYIFFVGVWVYRFLFSYLRWAYPLAELSEQLSRPKRHRIFWWGIVSIIMAKLFWDLFDPYISLKLLFSSSKGPPG